MMFFGKKDNRIKCDYCKSKIDEKFNFCPHCGNSTISEREELKEFGLLGRNDLSNIKETKRNPLEDIGLTDKMLSSLMNSVMKSFGNQFRNMAESASDSTRIEHFPNGIKIRVGIPQDSQNKQPKQKQSIKKQITGKQIEKMSNLPRGIAKTSVRRLSDKIVYELSAPGIESTEDVFISRLETGYEIKAIGKNKVYVNSLPINLPLKGFSIANNKLLVEFKPEK